MSSREQQPPTSHNALSLRGLAAEPEIVVRPVTFAHTKVTITGNLTVGKFTNRVDNTFGSLRRLLRVHYLEVDLSGITAIDEAGVRLLQKDIRAAEASGTRVEVAGASMEIKFLLAAAGLLVLRAEGGTRP
jgi:ABC-type transporter Mla MlaB component